MIVGKIQIIYVASASHGRCNLKKKKKKENSLFLRISYGFHNYRIGSLSNMGLNGAILQIISHGFIGAALFFLWERVMIENVLFISTK